MVLLALSFFLVLLIILLLRYSGLDELLLDRPNARSLHGEPIPKTGGIGIIIGILYIGNDVSSVFTEFNNIYIIPLLLIAIVSLIDDIKELSPKIRIFVHIIASVLVIVYLPLGHDGDSVHFIILLILVTLTVWFINLYNFMDGLDGLAGGMTVIGFISISIIAFNNGAIGYANGALLFSSVVLGFLLLNIPPAKIFMGDTGSATLGMLVTIYALLGIRLGILKVPEFLIIFSVFIADATLTLSRRVLQLQAFWKAHKTHYYQQLAEARPGKQGALYIEYMLMIASGIIVVIVNSLEIKQQIMLAITWYAALFFGFIILGDKLKTSKHSKIGTI